MRRIVSLVLMGLLLAGLLASVAVAKEPIRGPGFRASAPSGWHQDKTSGNGWNSLTVIAPQRRSALVSIAVASATTVKKAGDISDKNKLIQSLLSIPPDAAGLDTSFGPAPTTLAGKRGVTMGVHYNSDGHGTVHTATLVRRGKRFYLIQVITDENVTFLGQSAVNSIRGSWRWK